MVAQQLSPPPINKWNIELFILSFNGYFAHRTKLLPYGAMEIWLLTIFTTTIISGSSSSSSSSSSRYKWRKVIYAISEHTLE